MIRAGVLWLGHHALRVWWRVRRPTTYGVKALLIHPSDPEKCLVVRHSSADRERWGLPGGDAPISRWLKLALAD